jgi:hypothetical protein
LKESKCKNMFSIILIAVILLISIAISDRILLNSYGQTLDKTYTNQRCGISIQYPSDWKSEDYTSDDGPGHVINYIVEFQPNNSEGFNNVVGIELNDISTLSDKSFAGVKDFERSSLSDDQQSLLVRVEKLETTKIAGYPAEKIVYNELISGDKKMDIFTVAFDREYKITYDASSEYYDKYLSTVDKMIQTFTINQPTFEGINC